MTTINVRNFDIRNIESLSLTATPSSARIKIPDLSLPDMMLINQSGSTIFVRCGDSSVVADAQAMPILPGEKGIYARGLSQPTSTHIAAFVTDETEVLTIIQGGGA